MKVVKVLFMLMSILWMQPSFVFAQDVEDRTLIRMEEELKGAKEDYNRKKNDFEKEKGSLPDGIRNRRQADLDEMAKGIQRMEEYMQEYIEDKKKEALAKQQQEEDNKKKQEEIKNIIANSSYPKSNYVNENKWQIIYPNGNRLTSFANDQISVYLEGKKCFFIVYEVMMEEVKPLDMISGKTNQLTLKTLYPSSFRMGVFDADSIPEAELHKIIKETVLPMFSFPQKDVAIDFYYSRDKQLYSTEIEERNLISLYRNGIYKTKAELEKESEKEALAKRQEFNKKYGKTFVDAIYNGRLLVGMPLNLITDSQISWATAYKMHYYNNGESGDVKIVIHVVEKTMSSGWGGASSGVYTRTYRAWLQNHKITKFRDWNNMDEREFNRL